MTLNVLTQVETTVKDVMSSPVKCIHMDTTLMTARRILDKERIHHFVIKENDIVVGVVSDRDILRALSPFLGNKMMARAQDEQTLKLRIHKVMSRELVIITEDKCIIVACKQMLKEHVSCLLVYDNSKNLVGILTMRDVVDWVAKSASKA